MDRDAERMECHDCAARWHYDGDPLHRPFGSPLENAPSEVQR